MGYFRRILDAVMGRGSPAAPAPSVRAPQHISARYESARTTPDNASHWSQADDLSANAANSADVRRTLRRRARLERDNDGYLCAVTKQLAHDLVGTGPRLQLNLPPEHSKNADDVAASWKAWAKAVNLGEKLRLLHEPRSIDGETFGLLTTNPLVAHPVKLDLQPLEADQVETPGWGDLAQPNFVSGIEFDRYRNPAFYHVLKQHPGDGWVMTPTGHDRVPARFVLHWFRPSRPGQARGVSEFAPVLDVGGQTRRYSRATITKAEFASKVVGVLETDNPPPGEDDGDGDDMPAAMDRLPVTDGTLLTLPGRTKANFAKVDAPGESHAAFCDTKRTEMGRPVLMPRNRVTGDSSNFNFASGRLDALPYQDTTWIERDQFETRVLNRLFVAWYQEARLVGLIPDALPALNEWTWTWGWDAPSSISPIDDASTSEKELALGVTTFQDECAARGRDWRQVIDQQAEVIAYARRKGVPLYWLQEPAPADPAPEEEEGAAGEA